MSVRAPNTDECDGPDQRVGEVHKHLQVNVESKVLQEGSGAVH